MIMTQGKLTGTEAFPFEPSIDMWTEIQTLGDHELDNFDFDIESDLLLQQDEQHQQEYPIVLINEEDLDCKRKRSQNANARHPAKKRKSTGSSSCTSCDDESILSQTDHSVQSAQLPFTSPIELDQLMEHSLSTLALSMKRSAISRQRVIRIASSLNVNSFGSQSLLSECYSNYWFR